MSILCCLCVWVLLICFCWSICIATKDATSRLKRLHQIPCSDCVFFTGDYHLKCTVHPFKALTEDAIDCRDFEPNCPAACRSCPKTPFYSQPLKP